MRTSKNTIRATHSRTIALFPGAFRPPHKAHLIAIRSLLARSDIDQIVRIIPGTTQALAADVALKILHIFVHDEPRINIEIAPHTAIKHAFSYFNKCQAGDHLIFCIGENDARDGDVRFNQLAELSQNSGITAETTTAPTGSMSLRATDLRKMLDQDKRGQQLFFSALPESLSSTQKNQVWELCQSHRQEISHLLQQKIVALIQQHQLGELNKLQAAGHKKLDQVFIAQFSDRSSLYLKYAGDTLVDDTGKVNDKITQPKPRRRIATERRTLQRLRDYQLDTVELAELVLFDKATWSSAQTEVLAKGNTLQDELISARFDPAIASKISHFLANCHNAPAMPPVWGEIETDQQHWQTMLERNTTGLSLEPRWHHLKPHLQQLKQASQLASSNHLYLLDLKPSNIRIQDNTVGIVDFELCSTVGDPAFDLGRLLADYLSWGISTESITACADAISAILSRYQQTFKAWGQISTRLLAFCAVGLLKHSENKTSKLCSRHYEVAEKILNAPYCETATQLLDQLIKGSGVE